MRRYRRWVAVAGLVASGSLIAACGGGSSNSNASGGGSGGTPSAGSHVTLTWWHNATADPGKSEWQKIADNFHSSHSNVSFTIDPIQNEQFNSKVPAALESSNPPDLFQQWGGGAEATQVQSGKLMDISAQVSPWVGQLGTLRQGLAGQRQAVRASRTTTTSWASGTARTCSSRRASPRPPTTMTELNADVTKLKAAGIAPIAHRQQGPLAGRVLLGRTCVLRECPKATIDDGHRCKQDFSDACFTYAGQRHERLLEDQPVPERLPRHPGTAGCRQLRRPGGQRQGRHGAPRRLGDRP